jgi:adenylate cyclase
MAEQRAQRRLAAILAADVVGYSRLMRADETGTLAQLNAIRRELLDPKISEYGGRIVKTTGDGLLIEFPSAVDAVQYAVNVQGEMAQRNASVSADQRMDIRIGINVGDVIVEDNDLFGDGVNVAARLEGLADPGGICVSGSAHEQVRHKLDLAFEDLGEQSVKNIDELVRVYKIGTDGGDQPLKAFAVAQQQPIQDKPSIAVLAFNNMSGDAEQEYFSDGIAEDIITDMSKISGLFVIARNSSFTYKGTSIDLKRVASELGVKFVLEGSVRKAGNKVRVTAQLIDGTTGGHLWADRYDRNLDDIFAIQDDITRNIVDALKLQLDLDDKTHLGGPGTTNIEAHDFVLRGRSLLHGMSAEGIAESSQLFERAIELDPTYITAYWGRALTLFMLYANGWNDAGEETLETGCRIAQKAVEIDPSDPEAHWVVALGRMWKHDMDGALSAIDKAVAEGPNFAEVHATRGYILSFASRPAEAIESLDKAMRLDPQFPAIWLHFLAHAYVVLGDFEQATSLLKRRIRRQPETDSSRVLLASCHGHLGLISEAKEEWTKLLEINPDYSIERRGKLLPYSNPTDWGRIIEGLRLAGVHE